MNAERVEAASGRLDTDDTMQIRRVANGWVVMLGCRGPNDFTHIAATPEELGEHVRKWAEAQRTSRRKG